MQAILVSTDLMLMASAQGAADRHRVELACAAPPQALEQPGSSADLIVIDLRSPQLNIGEFVPRARQAHPRATIVACGPHVHRDSLRAAAEAGCDEVMTRGEFDRRFDALLIPSGTRAPTD